MSADLVTVKEVIAELLKLPQNMLVVGYGIDGWCKGEKLDGVEVYIQIVKEEGDGFIPQDEKKFDEEDLKAIRDENYIDCHHEVVVISPISKDLLLEWCDLT